jgi:hypothetical protein
MKRWSASGTTLALGGAALVALVPALAQEVPESLLPPGFGEPPPPAATPAPAAPAPGDLPPIALTVPPPEAEISNEADGNLSEAEAAAAEAEADELELPTSSRRSTALVGVLDPTLGGMSPDAWGQADGRFLTTLMRRLDAPVASRWTSILLRRALLSRTAAPGGVDPVDWVAERAWLLVRMGEADAARMLVQAVDRNRYTPRMIAVAQQVALATADLAALCPIADEGAALGKEPSWPLSQAICAALAGDPGVAGAGIDRVRTLNTARGVDLLLAEKAIGAGSNGRRSINIEWTGVGTLTAWRFGLAHALGVTVPAGLYDTAGPQVRAWAARAPMLPVAQRIEHARTAASLGVFSGQSLVDLYGVLADDSEEPDLDATPAGRLRLAYAADDQATRMVGLRALWPEDGGDPERYAALILTGHAAARIRPDDDLATDAEALIGAMLSVGLDRAAQRWTGVTSGMTGAAGDRTWALLALGAPNFAGDLSAGRVERYLADAGDGERMRARLVLAGLAGLGRLPAAEAGRIAAQNGFSVGEENRWSRALAAAVRSRQPATVALLAAVGLQTRSWRAVPPAALFHAVAALRRVGMEPEARMLAAEAAMRT